MNNEPDAQNITPTTTCTQKNEDSVGVDVGSNQPSSPSCLKGKVFSARALYTREGRDRNWTVLSLDGVNDIAGSLVLPAEKSLVSKGDRLRVQIQSKPYTHNGRTYVRVWLLERLGIPKMLQEYRRSKRMEERSLTALERSSGTYRTTHTGETSNESSHRQTPSPFNKGRFGLLVSDDYSSDDEC